MALPKADLREIESDGETYITVTQELYDALYASLEHSEQVRFVAVENFRVWCEANKGVDTVEEGLRACTPEELYQQCYAAGGDISSVMRYIECLVDRLADRTTRAAAELVAAPVETIMPDEEEGETNGTDDH